MCAVCVEGAGVHAWHPCAGLGDFLRGIARGLGVKIVSMLEAQGTAGHQVCAVCVL